MSRARWADIIIGATVALLSVVLTIGLFHTPPTHAQQRPAVCATATGTV